jgi:hypothetical protein
MLFKAISEGTHKATLINGIKYYPLLDYLKRVNKTLPGQFRAYYNYMPISGTGARDVKKELRKGI